MPTTQVPVSSTQILATLLLCGLMGVLGQGIRAAIGLKNAMSATGPDGLPTQQSQFNAAYFLISLMIGFIAGVLAGIAVGLDQLMQIDPSNLKVLLGIAAAGYAGADFIENSFARLVPGIGAGPARAVGDRPLDPPGTVVTRVADAPAAAAEIVGLRAAVSIAAPKVNAAKWTPALSAAFVRFEMTSHHRMAAALGQFLVEAGGSFQDVVENLTYTHAERIHAEFPDEIASVEDAEAFVDRPEALGDRVYADRNGNGDEASGDGYRFRGRGLIQLTGRATYTQFAAAMGKSLDGVVAYCETPEGAAMCGCWYLSTRHCLTLADDWQISRITRAVNGPAMSGAAQRLAYSTTALKALGG